MNKDYIIRIAQEVGLAPAAYRNYGNQIGRLEALVKFFLAKEREACAILCDELADEAAKDQDFFRACVAEDCAEVIRERGEQWADLERIQTILNGTKKPR
jgi:hypothetical protein